MEKISKFHQSPGCSIHWLLAGEVFYFSWHFCVWWLNPYVFRYFSMLKSLFLMVKHQTFLEKWQAISIQSPFFDMVNSVFSSLLKPYEGFLINRATPQIIHRHSDGFSIFLIEQNPSISKYPILMIFMDPPLYVPYVWWLESPPSLNPKPRVLDHLHVQNSQETASKTQAQGDLSPWEMRHFQWRIHGSTMRNSMEFLGIIGYIIYIIHNDLYNMTSSSFHEI